jgi:hypothetical protein
MRPSMRTSTRSLPLLLDSSITVGVLDPMTLNMPTIDSGETTVPLKLLTCCQCGWHEDQGHHLLL